MTALVRCCLIQLYSDLQPANAEPLSVEALAGAIAHYVPNVSTSLLIFGVHYPAYERQRMLDHIAVEAYDLIGISSPQGTLEDALLILDTIYQQSSPPHVVIGHALATSMPEIFLDRFPRALIVRGWGEDAIVELCRQVQRGKLDIETIPSLTYRDSAGVRRDNPLQTYLVGVPQRLEPSRYFCRVESSRGCHYDVCTFCSRFPRLKNSAAWKRLNLDDVIAQVQTLSTAHVRAFTFTDEDFIGNDPEGALKIAEALSEIPDLEFTISVRVDSVIDRRNGNALSVDHALLFKTLRKAGLSMVFMGAESFSATQLRRYGKGVTPQENVAAVRALEAYGIDIELGMIMFDPLVTANELRENVDILLQTGYYKYVGYPFSFMRAQINTPYAALLKKHGLLSHLNPNLAAYDAHYVSSYVATIATQCRDLLHSFNSFYAALRNAQRSSPSVTHAYRHALHEVRLIQVEYLASLLQHSEREFAQGVPSPEPWLARLEHCREEVTAAIWSSDAHGLARIPF